jgi:uncharacterized delta-60 repeat protein
MRKPGSEQRARLRRAVELQILESRILFSGPAASFAAAPTFTAGASNFAVTVDYSDSVAINPATIAPTNFSVIGPKAGALRVTGDVIATQSPDNLSVTYYVNAPNQIFDQRANDTYTLAVQPNSVFDEQGAAASTATTTMVVNLTPNTGPLAAASAPSFTIITAPGATGGVMEITYSDPLGVNVSTISSANITSFSSLHAQLLSVASQDSGTVVHATYRLTAPRGAFYPQDDTGYHMVLAPSGPGAVLDTAGNVFSSGVLALYEVDIIPNSPAFPFADAASPLFVPEASAHQSDGKLIVVGHIGDTTAGLSQIEIERFNVNGTPDATFGDDGVVLGPSGDNEAAFALQMLPNDQFVVAGTSQREFALERYTANGALDTSFGPSGTGQVTTTIANNASIEMADTIALAPDGSIVIAGQSDGAWAFARFTSSGILSNSFLFALPSGNVGTIGGLAVQSNGLIVAAGVDGSQVDVGRFEPTGTPDPSFNGGNIETLSGMSGRQDLGYLDHNVGLGIDANGEIVVAAASKSSPTDFAVERLLANGSPDTSFGSDGTGLVITPFAAAADAQNVAFGTSGQIIVSGITIDSSGTHPASITYTSNGSRATGTPPPPQTISGVVFNGQSGAPQAAVTVFLDANGNGSFDEGELSTTTSASGAYVFANVADGTYSVDEVAPAGFVSQTPEAAVTVSGSSAAGPNFDNLPAPASAGSAAADLTASFASVVPSAAVARTKGQLTLHVSNVGQAVGGGTIEIALFASSDGTIAAGDTPFATIPQRIKLAAGHSTNLKLKFDYPSNLANGNYFIVASVDSTNIVAESNEANNFAATARPVAIGLASVNLEGTLGAPSSIAGGKGGKKAMATLVLNNSGNVTASGTVHVSLFASAGLSIDGDDPSLGATKVHIKLLPGHSRSFRVRLTLPASAISGSQFVIAQLNASGIANISDSTLVIPAANATTFG